MRPVQDAVRQFVYSVSYSASRWPASTASLTDCIPGLSPMQCLNFYREQGALIEVFFEQLNYESLLEGEAYGLPNLLSDFGGQLGLWMGVSVITIMEFGILTIDVIMTIICCKGSDDNKKEPKRSYSSRNGSQKRYRANDKVRANSAKRLTYQA
ncbi:unnamed protein product [Toxocara canis]|uniref:Degenerin-like protein unc-105 n=1 Tax=Toxocara canis TaxID=6265 RepID=A0A183TXE1_TOXCA|nr:unnamed protein product [Toxocara canis]